MSFFQTENGIFNETKQFSLTVFITAVEIALTDQKA